MLDNKSKVALVILSWNDPDNTFELIKSIYNSSYDYFDVMLLTITQVLKILIN